MGVCAWGVKKPNTCPDAAFQGPPPPWFACIKLGLTSFQLILNLRFFGVFSYPFLHPKRVENTIFHHFLRRFSLDHQIQQDLFMDALIAHSYNTLVEFKRESYYEKKFRRQWSSFSCGDRAFLQRFLGDAIALLQTTLAWHLLEVITPCWDPVLRCDTIGNVDLVHTLKEYDHFLSLSTPLSTIFVPLVQPCYYKRLTNLLGFKRPVVEAFTWYGSRIGGTMSFDFLYDQFHSLECLVGY